MGSRIIGKEELVIAADHLCHGELVVFPTDTVYGVAALAESETAVRSIFQAKMRPQGMALPVMVSDYALVRAVAHPLPGLQTLADHFWPGPLTIILPKTDAIPDIVTSGQKTVAVRIPDHPTTLQILRLVAKPLAVTSANLSGQPPAVTAAEAVAQLGEYVAIAVDDGPARGGEPSTILDLTVKPPRILRAGPIHWHDIAGILEAEGLGSPSDQ